MVIEIDTMASDFALPDQNGDVATLSSFKGKMVLLSFRPLAWTPVCRDQMKSLDLNHQRLERLGTIPLGIGVDSVPSNRAWAESMAIKQTRILSDFWPHGRVAKLYGVFREADGFSERANIIVDAQGRVIFARVYPTSQRPDIEEIIRFLER